MVTIRVCLCVNIISAMDPILIPFCVSVFTTPVSGVYAYGGDGWLTLIGEIFLKIFLLVKYKNMFFNRVMGVVSRAIFSRVCSQS